MKPRRFGQWLRFLHDVTGCGNNPTPVDVKPELMAAKVRCYIYIHIYICVCVCVRACARGFKMSGDVIRLPHSIAFDYSIHPFSDLFHSCLNISHLSRFFRDGLDFSFLQVAN